MNIHAPGRNKFYYLLFGILLFGVLAVYDASPHYSQRLFDDPYYITKLQIVWVIIGLVFFFVFSIVDIFFLKKLGKFLFISSVTLLLFVATFAVIVPCSGTDTKDIPFCPCKNGARRWVNLNPPPLPAIPGIGILGFQVSDLAKLALVLYLPVIIEQKKASSKNPYAPFIYSFGLTLLVSISILLQPNMSNAALTTFIGLSIFFISGLNLKPLFIVIPIGLIVGILFILLSPYRRERFMTLAHPDSQSSLHESYQSDQILIGLGSGGFFGVGVGQSKQKQHYLPEVIGDSIFAIVGEETGFFGSVVILIAFALLFTESLGISALALTSYEKMLGTGVTAWLFFQYLINLYSTIVIIPFTGMPIPLISYGGSSMIFSLAGLGLLSNILIRLRKKQSFIVPPKRGRIN